MLCKYYMYTGFIMLDNKYYLEDVAYVNNLINKLENNAACEHTSFWFSHLLIYNLLQNRYLTIFLYHLSITVNTTHELGRLEEISIPANETMLILSNLNYSTRYKFYFYAQTSVGSGNQITEEAVTITYEGKMGMYSQTT